MILVGVGGARGSGKNTFAKLCIEEIFKQDRIGYEASWAALLKRSVMESLGFDCSEMTDPEVIEYCDCLKDFGGVQVIDAVICEEPYEEVVQSISFRKFLQNYGTEAHRNIFSDNFWVEQFWANNEFGEDHVVFICDTRFDNEAASVIEHGGKNIRIHREVVEESLEDEHASEAGFDPKYLDIIIDNNGDMTDLRAAAKTFVNDLLGNNG